MTDRAPQEPLAYGTVATLEEARTAADDARRDGLRGKYPAALVVMDMAYARLVAQQAAPPQPTKRHPNDKDAYSEACEAAITARGDNEGQGLDPYWAWGFRQGYKTAEGATQPRAPLTEADLPQHPYGGPSPGLVWTISERRAILAWGNALLGIKPAGDAP